ncbi:MAG: MDR family oxidoreductase [Alphaproteobacteria bacterium]|nr:MDR family oxidoreductase [Alphaproteobacteria bacterium]
MSFKALVLEQGEDGKIEHEVKELEESSLPEGDVTVAVEYSTLNYKDGLVLNGLGNLVKEYPHVGGIDFAGTVESSDSPDYQPGDQVILTGWRVGEIHWGGYSQKARVKSDWLVPMPDGLTTKRAMGLGTAGLTSMLSILALERLGLDPDRGQVLVTGAAGGVGSVAVAVLANLGYDVAASTGRTETHAYLKDLGAKTIIDRAELAEVYDRPLLSARFAGAVDTVGGSTLATVLASMKPHASVASCGLAGGAELHTTVMPFIIRGVNLLGIDSATCPAALRREAWGRLVEDLPMDKLDAMIDTVTLSDLADLRTKILKGQIRGRTVVDVNA